MTWRLLQGDSIECLRQLDAESVQTVVTSPPYWGLRDYGADGQLGLEPTPEQYVVNLVNVFREVRRVLRADGTVWLNLGDSYAGGGGHSPNAPSSVSSKSGLYGDALKEGGIKPHGVIKAKDLVGIPWRVAFALQADGWWLRSDIIWAKPNPMPESVTDRPTRSHEYVFLLTKNARYFYDADAVREPGNLEGSHSRGNATVRPGIDVNGGNQATPDLIFETPGLGRNKRSVWTIATQPFPEAHFATFPPKLVEPCILAGTSPKACGECGAPWGRATERGELVGVDRGGNYRGREDEADAAWQNRMKSVNEFRPGMAYENRMLGWQPTCVHDDDSGRCVVLDPFCGSGTTGVVALRHDRSFIGIELNEAYCEMARNRIRDDAPLLNVGIEAA